MNLALFRSKLETVNLGLGLRSKLQSVVSFTKNTVARPNLYDLKSSERVGCTYHEPSDMCPTDRLMLYALVRGLRPKLALEIGVRWGGSARIITNAMQDNDLGQLVGIDPMTENFRVGEQELHGRYFLLKGYSPQDVPAAVEKLKGGPLDFVLIDGMHVYDAVKADFEGVMPFLADGAHILFHDTYHQGIDRAIRDVLAAHPGLVDCGFITRNPEPGSPVSYQGLRLVRKGVVNSEGLITESYQRNSKPVPPFSEEYWNYDPYYNRMKDQAPK
jgi:predicted O-methyltransferase YrrM